MPAYRLPAGLARVYRNTDGPSRFTGTLWCWIAETEGRKTFCNTREEARNVVADYRRKRRDLIRQGERAQGRAEFWKG